MTYAEAVSYLLTFGQELRGVKFDLANVTRVLDELGRPHDAFRAVHVAGTNGKGSAAAMLEAVLRAAGVRTGLYTSPHLVRPNERIRVAGQDVSDADFAGRCTEVREATERMIAAHALPTHPSFFESLTAMAFQQFRCAAVHLAVLETGMGGRLDATNVVTPLVSVITRIDFDHEAFLGNTLAQIASEKAGIIKPGRPVVTVPQRPEAQAVLERVAAERQARLVVADAAGAAGYRLALAGRHQRENAAAVLATVRELRNLGLEISEDAVREGLARVSWPGRLELAPGRPAVLFDGAHNPAGARALRDYLDEEARGRRTVVVFGAMRDKAVGEIADVLFPAAYSVVLTHPQQKRAASPEAIAALTRDLNARLSICLEPAAALAEARQIAGPDGLVVVTGSLYLVGQLRNQTPRVCL